MSNNGNGTLNPKQQRFVEEYLKDLNATRAYSRTYDVIGPTAEVNGCRLLSNAKVQHAVAKLAEQRTKEAGVTVERVLKELVRMAWVDIGEAYEENGGLKPIHEMPEDVRRAILAVETEEIWEWQDDEEDKKQRRRVQIGVVRKVKFADKRGSNELLGKYLKMFVERHEFGLGDDLLQLLEEGRRRVANAR